jgi:serine protease Do
LISCFALVSLTSQTIAAAQPADFSEAAEKVMPGVVSIQVTKRSRMRQTSQLEDEFLRHFFGRGYPGRGQQGAPAQQGQGSGFIIDRDGYILTNNHVVGGADEIEVHLHDGRKLQAKLIGADEKSDVAVIKVNEPELPTLKLGRSKSLKIGQWVLAVGNSFGLSATLTVGVISATGRAGMGITDYEEFIQTDAAINPGNSGGPLLNINGEVIGINTAIYSRSGGYMGIGFAIPIHMALKIKDQLIKYGEVRRGKIGAYIQELTPQVSKSLGLSDTTGVLISDVIPDSPADRAGMQAGDVVVELQGEKVTSAASFRNRVSLTTPNSIADVKVIRRGAELSLKIKIGSLDGRSSEPSREVEPERTSRADKYGLEVEDLNRRQRRELKLRDQGGVLIVEVKPGSVAHRAGLSAGQVILSVNQTTVSNVRAFKKLVQKAKGSLLLQIRSEQGVRFIVLSKS